MPDRERVRLMARLALLEKQYGRKIRKAENTSRIDLITNPVWRWGFGITLLFFLVCGALAALNADMVLDAVARDQTRNLIMTVLIAWLSCLAVTIVIAFTVSLTRERRMRELTGMYHEMLQKLERSTDMTGRYNSHVNGSADDLWDEPADDRRRRHGRGRSRDDGLDYNRMQVLEFEDDDFCYYVEAVPKRGGRRE